MKIAVLGSGSVGAAIGSKLATRGHDVRMGTRDAQNPKAVAWAATAGPRASVGTFLEASRFGGLAFLCTAGPATVDVAKAAAAGLEGKVVIDVTNPLDFSTGRPPYLFLDSRDSLAERVQAAVPKARVVKSLNTMTASLMVNPAAVPGEHNVFVAGNDAAARAETARLLEQDFGWPKTRILDLGDLTAARGLEHVLPLWIRLRGILGSGMFNWQIVRPPG